MELKKTVRGTKESSVLDRLALYKFACVFVCVCVWVFVKTPAPALAPPLHAQQPNRS